MRPAGEKEGLWLVDKPVGVSSFAMVSRLRKVTGIRKVGHTGTLDPLASGLMILLAGKAWTKRADEFIKKDKVYEVELRLGEASTTGDSEGSISQVSDARPSSADVRKTLASFVGTIEQIPPVYSAIKVDGVRAYKLARQGKMPELKAREVKIYSIDEVIYDYPIIKFTTKVSSGTYIRSLVEDIGRALATGAYMTALKRTQIGEYRIEQATQLD